MNNAKEKITFTAQMLIDYQLWLAIHLAITKPVWHSTEPQLNACNQIKRNLK